MASPHTPVLLAEVIAALTPRPGVMRPGAVLVDGTYGAGGYSAGFLAATDCRVFGIDRDPNAVATGRADAAKSDGRLTMLEGRFGEMDRLLAEVGVAAADGVALDLGVSSMQIDQAERGFSFRFDGPLDMRMEQAGESAADTVATLPEAELADIIWRYGEERHSRRVARAIVAARREAAITTTGQLAAIVRRAVPRSKDGIDQATRTFQALRIHVNDELGEINRGLAAAERLLAPGGRLAVVSFHSLEDRLVKDFLRRRSDTASLPSRHLPVAAGPPPSFTLLSKRPTAASDAEVAANPRARSARLRAAERTDAPAFAEAA